MCCVLSRFASETSNWLALGEEEQHDARLSPIHRQGQVWAGSSVRCLYNQDYEALGGRLQLVSGVGSSDGSTAGEQSAGRVQQLLQQRQEQAGHEDKGRTVLLGAKPTKLYRPLPNSFSIAHGHQPRGLKATKRTAPCSSHLLRAENEAG
jgi:hypothetical protein